MSKSRLFEEGLEVRKEVLGEDYVNKSIAGADEFTRTMAEWSTEFCWGAIWTRPGLDRRTRSIINLAMLCALGRLSMAFENRANLTTSCARRD